MAIIGSSGKSGGVVAKDVLAHRWRDSGHVWLLQAVGKNHLTLDVRPLVSDVKGALKPAGEAFPVLPMGQWTLSSDGRWFVTTGAELEAGDDAKGLWLFNLERLRGEQE